MTADHDARYLEGIRLFNRQEFFACHDVLEDLWGETLDKDREFYQGLIHAAVCLFHFEGGNLSGARKMYESATRYLRPYGDTHMGLDLDTFLRDMEACFAELLVSNNQYPTGVELDPDRIPTIQLNSEVLP